MVAPHVLVSLDDELVYQAAKELNEQTGRAELPLTELKKRFSGTDAAFYQAITNLEALELLLPVDKAPKRGSVRRNPNPPQPLSNQIDEANKYPKEKDLYPAMLSALQAEWSKPNYDPVWIVDTSQRPAPKAILESDEFTRPDLTLVGRYNPPGEAPSFQLVTFELKRRYNFGRSVVAEAEHQREHCGATASYVVLHVPKYHIDDGVKINTIKEAAKEKGIGLIILTDPLHPDTWLVEKPIPRALDLDKARDYIGLAMNEVSQQAFQVLDDLPPESLTRTVLPVFGTVLPDFPVEPPVAPVVSTPPPAQTGIATSDSEPVTEQPETPSDAVAPHGRHLSEFGILKWPHFGPVLAL